MTRQKLVVDGNEVKFRLEAARKKSAGVVHVDWLRFTCQFKNAPVPVAEVLFPSKVTDSLLQPRSIAELEDAEWRRAKMLRILRDMPDAEFAASAQAHALAEQVCKALGAGFTVYPEVQKGHDFYRFRWSIVRNGVECAWIGYLASGDSPRQKSQSKTIHANIYGTACTFAQLDWRNRMAKVVEECDAKITRIDYALDFFDGISGGLDRVRDDWHASAMDVKGRRPKANTVGPWVEGGRGRSFYFGSKEAGKQTNVYEKGVQLFGEQDATRWERIELRYGNKMRILSADMLRRPDNFFAGASDWHSGMLAEHGRACIGQRVKVQSKQAIETVRAEVTRSIRWLTNTAAPSLALAFKFLGENEFLELVTGRAKPGRLEKFSDHEISVACAALSPAVYQPKARFGQPLGV